MMNKITLNTGHFFYRPFESPYSMWRRFASANRYLNRTKLLEALDISDESDIENAIINLNYPIGMKPGYLYILQEVTQIPMSQCPECCASGYHTDLFNLPWVTRCPIHECELTQFCPDCRKKWPDYRTLFSRNCKRCGRLSLKDMNYTPRLDKSSETYECFNKLFSFIDFCRPKNSYLQGSLNSVFRSERNTIEYWSKLFPNFQRMIYPKDIDDSLKKVGVDLDKIKCISSMDAELNELKEGNVFYSRHDCYMKPKKTKNIIEKMESDALEDNVRVSTFYKIQEMINNITGEDHPFVIYDLRQINPIDFSREQFPCIYCLALSLWFYTASDSPKSVHRNPAREFCLALRGIAEGIVAPVPLDTLVIGNRAYSLPTEFTKRLYERDLLYLFKSILLLLIEKVPDITHKEFRYIQNDSQKIVDLDRTDFIEPIFFSTSFDTIHVFFAREMLLQESSIPIVENAKVDCEAFYRYLYHRYMLPQRVRHNSSRLTEEELSALKNSYDFARTHHAIALRVDGTN